MFQSSDHRYFYEIQTAHSRMLMVFDRCSQRSYTSSNNKTLNARLLARRHKFVTGATLLQLVLHQCMNTVINRTCRASNKCEPPDIPVKFFANQHKLSCISSIHARINQKIMKTAIGPKFPYRR